MVFKIKMPSLNTRAPEPEEQDSLVRLVGHFGLWQLLVFGSVSLVKFPTGWVQMAILFLTPKVTFHCAELPENATAVEGMCYQECLRYETNSWPMASSPVGEWELVCGRAWLASFTQTLLQLGVLLGSIVFGFLADRYGRRFTFLGAVTAMTALGLAVPFAPDYVTFTTLRFLLGAATAGVMVVSFVIVMEAVGPRYRELFGCLFQIPFIIGHLTVPLVAYYCREWRTFLLVLGGSNLVFLSYFFFVSESPRWLISVGRVDDAAKIVVKAAKMNKLPTGQIDESLKKLSLETKVVSPERLNYGALLGRGLRVRTAVSLLMWLVTGLTFFGFNQYLGQTSPDPFISVTVAALVQFPANFLSMWLTRQVGRKATTIGSFIVCGGSIIALGLLPKVFWVSLVLGGTGSGVAALAATTIYIYSSELFPTVVRNMGVGASSMAMRVGSMVAPFVANLGSSVPWLPSAIFGITPLVAAAAVFLLPETCGRTLPDTLDDVDPERLKARSAATAEPTLSIPTEAK